MGRGVEVAKSDDVHGRAALVHAISCKWYLRLRQVFTMYLSFLRTSSGSERRVTSLRASETSE